MKNEQITSLLKLLIPPLAAFLVAGIADAGTFVEKMASFAGIATLVPLFVEALKVQWDFSDKDFLGMRVARWISWLLSLALVYISHAVGWAFVDFGAFGIIIYGIGAGLVSNGYFTIEQVQLFLAILTGNTTKLNKLKK
jgi:hypothetical protein